MQWQGEERVGRRRGEGGFSADTWRRAPPAQPVITGITSLWLLIYDNFCLFAPVSQALVLSILFMVLASGPLSYESRPGWPTPCCLAGLAGQRALTWPCPCGSDRPHGLEPLSGVSTYLSGRFDLAVSADSTAGLLTLTSVLALELQCEGSASGGALGTQPYWPGRTSCLHTPCVSPAPGNRSKPGILPTER